MAAEPGPQLSEQTLRSIDLHQIGEHRWKATNARGGGVSIGPGEDPDFTPVELFLAALAGCGAADLDYIAGKRAPFETFRARAEGHKIRDGQGTHMVQLKVTLDVTFPEGAGGDAAREIMPRTLQQIEDRLCTIARTVSLGEPVAYVEGEVTPMPVLGPGKDPAGSDSGPSDG
jgi:uncharacterized OsmC-like protein